MTGLRATVFIMKRGQLWGNPMYKWVHALRFDRTRIKDKSCSGSQKCVITAEGIVKALLCYEIRLRISLSNALRGCLLSKCRNCSELSKNSCKFKCHVSVWNIFEKSKTDIMRLFIAIYESCVHQQRPKTNLQFFKEKAMAFHFGFQKVLYCFLSFKR